ncbi:MAG: hypothetical protein OHK0046_46190 [Anaerolineae bacterium]
MSTCAYTDDNQWIDAADLTPGEMILSLDGGYGVVEQVTVVADAHQPMFNLTVDAAHTFFIGDGDWLVHNVDGCPPFGLTNFDSDMSKNIEFNRNSLNSIIPENAGESFGAGWTGAFDIETNRFIAIPSDPMYTRTIDGIDDLIYLPNIEIKPENLQQGIVVARTGGHGAAAQILRRHLELNSPQDGISRIVGMNLSYWNANELTMGWKSNGLNLGSPYATGNQISLNFQEQIINTIKEAMPPSVIIK